jgi:hypothetical protein
MRVPVVVLIDDAERLDLDLAVVLLENLTFRGDGPDCWKPGRREAPGRGCPAERDTCGRRVVLVSPGRCGSLPAGWTCRVACGWPALI